MPESTLEKLTQAMRLQIEGNLESAESMYLDILQEEPDNPDGNHLLGLIRGEQDDNDEAIRLIEKAIRINQGAAPFHHNIAGIYRRTGRLHEAKSEFRRAIELKADYGEAYQGLAEMVTFKKGDPLLGQIQGQLANSGMEADMRGYFHFAAGKICDDIGAHDDAFRHYAAGNRDAGKNFDSAGFRQQIKDTIYVFSRAFVRHNTGTGDSNAQPVFIVGMPRSGTTLVEQILASHSRVFGAGELNDMKFIVKSASEMSSVKQAFPNCSAGISREGYARLAAEYLSRISNVTGGRSYDRVIDKHPLNFQFIGLILQMFPRARIINALRHPLDTCLSCFFQNFTRGQHYTFDLVKLAHFYNDYRRLMEHWEIVYPGKILNIEYEKILSDQESETRRLLHYCGLEFEEACLDFHETDRVVKTASFRQVRKPIYHSSLHRWKNYTRQLSEVAAILGIRIETPVTISSRSPLLTQG
jgi:tetratricopeptide (TPR) repeat protein